VVGGLIFGLLPEALRGVVAPEVQWIIYGMLMIAILLFLPKGIVPAFSGLAYRLRNRVAPSGPTIAVRKGAVQ
jgi:branched-chain amino acid transport system permease protein